MSKATLWTSTATAGTVALCIARVSGADVAARFISLRAGEGRTPEYLAINPKGQVPALQLPDGTVITENPAVAVAIAELAPGSGLIPESGPARLKALEWLAWCHYTQAGVINAALGGLRLAGGDEAAAAAVRAAGPARIVASMEIADRAIGSGRSLLGGDAVTAPDIFLMLLVRFAGFLKTDLSALHGVLRTVEAVKAHPGVVAALAEEAAEDARRAALQAPATA
ncbi:glutathione S-transferase family protein [Muricoccus radiodurans]|uniref:glutathione S-transferase family protein n=1 Tax=Muricoccus radiodurans TaxID=2231721 RepID=UPI003CEAD785